MAQQISDGQIHIAEVLDKHLETLVKAVAQPIDTFRWLVIALLVILFAKEFGIVGLRAIIPTITQQAQATGDS